MLRSSALSSRGVKLEAGGKQERRASPLMKRAETRRETKLCLFSKVKAIVAAELGRFHPFIGLFLTVNDNEACSGRVGVHHFLHQ